MGGWRQRPELSSGCVRVSGIDPPGPKVFWFVEPCLCCGGYPEAKVQLCIVHLVRAALKYVTAEDTKPVVAALKDIYQSATVVGAEQALEKFAEVWGEKYPTIVKQWRLK